MWRWMVGVMVIVGCGGSGAQPDAGSSGPDAGPGGPPIRLKKIVAAGGFACGVAEAGGMWCWGTNYFGDLGDGTSLSRARPTQVGSATDWTDVTARYNAACGLRADHSLWCWGRGDYGELGDGELRTSYTPVQVVSDKPGLGWSAVSLGRGDACAIHTDGSAACWGQDRAGGALRPSPVALDGNTDWTAIAAGDVSCGLRDGGHLYCWGYSTSGSLGLGDVRSQATPAQVGTDTWRAISVGYYNVCGIRSDGALLCWGKHPLMVDALQYGNTPQQIGTATDWESVALSYGAVLGLRAGGQAYVWGDNFFGELGLPKLAEVVEPTATAMFWSQLSPGNTHSCGLVGALAYCWGAIGEGLLGDGETTTWLTPTKLVDDRWTAVATGGGLVRGVRTDGALMSSGFIAGFGNTDPVPAPTRIGDAVWTGVVVSQGFFARDTCGLRGGAPSCWGDNMYGELGVGTSGAVVLAPTAAAVPPGSQWTELAMGDHTCAIRSDGGLYCWGSNFSGQLGDGTKDQHELPPAAPLPGTWRHVSITGATTCAIQTDHTLWCWGNDSPLDDQTIPHRQPTQVGTETDWDTIALGSVSPSGIELCAIKTSGTLWCWGTVPGGQKVASPAQVGTDTHWKSIALGDERCGVKTDGTLWCWDNTNILGDGSPLTLDLSGTVVRALAPTQIGSDTDWATVATGAPSCGLKLDGRVLCWGLAAAPRLDYSTTPVEVRLAP